MKESTFENFGSELFTALRSMSDQIAALTEKVATLETQIAAEKEQRESKYLFTNEAAALLKCGRTSFDKYWRDLKVITRYRCPHTGRPKYLRSEVLAVAEAAVTFEK